MLRSLLALSFLMLASCAAVQKDYDHMSTNEYRNRAQLRTSLVNPNEPLNEAVVQKILASRVVMPKSVNLAIVRLSDSADGLDMQMIDQDIAEKFYARANWGSRVQSIIPMPQVMISKPATLASLRQAAVLLQADALLIIKPASYSDWKMQWFEADKAKGVTSLEVLLLDTRTSVVPFTSIVTETAEVSKDGEYSSYELMNRAKKTSETKALMQIAPAVQKFLGSKAI